MYGLVWFKGQCRSAWVLYGVILARVAPFFPRVAFVLQASLCSTKLKVVSEAKLTAEPVGMRIIIYSPKLIHMHWNLIYCVIEWKYCFISQLCVVFSSSYSKWLGQRTITLYEKWYYLWGLRQHNFEPTHGLQLTEKMYQMLWWLYLEGSYFLTSL